MSYKSRKLSQTEKNHSALEQELSAIVHALNFFLVEIVESLPVLVSVSLYG